MLVSIDYLFIDIFNEFIEKSRISHFHQKCLHKSRRNIDNEEKALRLRLYQTLQNFSSPLNQFHLLSNMLNLCK